ncbi:hypothetical protein COHA_008341 [Chlorella ohadii]|uniref:PA domain-containing protein n=1 Tax=Chlorella ohadii TaxID=2649997 RepID=A0AAD5DK28_9CHLO|nr:hypothetical protein COHA_008341 [Chlorella ohadii]
MGDQPPRRDTLWEQREAATKEWDELEVLVRVKAPAELGWPEQGPDMDRAAAELKDWNPARKQLPAGPHAQLLVAAMDRCQEQMWSPAPHPAAQQEQQAQQQQPLGVEQLLQELASIMKRSPQDLAIAARHILSRPPGEGHLTAKESEVGSMQESEREDATFQPHLQRGGGSGGGGSGGGATGAKRHGMTLRSLGSRAALWPAEEEKQVDFDTAQDELLLPNIPFYPAGWKPVRAEAAAGDEAVAALQQQPCTAELSLQGHQRGFEAGTLLLSGGSQDSTLEQELQAAQRWGAAGVLLVSQDASASGVGAPAQFSASLGSSRGTTIVRHGLHNFAALAQAHPLTEGTPAQPALALRKLGTAGDQSKRWFAVAYGAAGAVGPQLAAVPSERLEQLLLECLRQPASSTPEQPAAASEQPPDQHSAPWVFSQTFPGGAAAACPADSSPALLRSGQVYITPAAGPLADALTPLVGTQLLSAVCCNDSSRGAAASSSSSSGGSGGFAVAAAAYTKPGFGGRYPYLGHSVQLAAELSKQCVGGREVLLVVQHEPDALLLEVPIEPGTAAAVLPLILTHARQLGADAAAVVTATAADTAATAARLAYAWRKPLTASVPNLRIPASSSAAAALLGGAQVWAAAGSSEGGLLRADDGAVQLVRVKVDNDKGGARLSSNFPLVRDSLLKQHWGDGQLCPAVAVAAGTGERPIAVTALTAAPIQQGPQETAKQRHDAAVEAAHSAAAALLPELEGLRVHVPEHARETTLLVQLPHP